MENYITKDGFIWLDITDKAKEVFSSGLFEVYSVNTDEELESLIETREQLEEALESGLLIAIEGGFVNKDLDVDVIIISNNGIIETPIVTLDEETGLATFREKVEELVGEDKSELGFIDSDELNTVKWLLKGTGKDIDWFRVPVNTYTQES